MIDTKRLRELLSDVDLPVFAKECEDYAEIVDANSNKVALTIRPHLMLALMNDAPALLDRVEELEGALQGLRTVALNHSNYGHVEGNTRAFIIDRDIERRLLALSSGEECPNGCGWCGYDCPNNPERVGEGV